MADERVEYVVDVMGVEHTMLLDPKSAEQMYGGRARRKEQPAKKEARAATKEKVPANKARTVETKGEV